MLLAELTGAEGADTFATLFDGGGPGFLIAFLIWKATKLGEKIGAQLSQIREQWTKSQRLQLRHFETEETLLRELAEERAQWDATREAKQAMSAAMMELSGRLDAIERRQDRIQADASREARL